jgi:multicomponent Na+:H+ antiporter subunit A
MVAPTPVSAYLHSAAMVAAGVFVLQRLHFLLELAPGVMHALAWIAGASLVAGSALALVSDRLKVVLAYSTVAQYGYVVLLVALGGEHGCAGAPLYVLVHGLSKSALFLTAGAVTLRTGAERLSATGGLARRMPWLAAASALAAAGLAGLPLTAGFFKDELFFAAAWKTSPALGVAAATAAALTLAYTLRFWFGIFGGRPRGPAAARGLVPHRALTAPVVALGTLVLLLGVMPGALTTLARAAGEVVARAPVEVELAYHFDLRAENVLALSAWIGGAALAAARGRFELRLARVLAGAAAWLGPRRWSERVAWALDRASDALHGVEVRDLRDRVGAILLAMSVVLVLGLLASAGYAVWRTGDFRLRDLPLALALLAAAGAALVVVREVQHQALILMISFVGFGLALAFAFSAAPDLALVAVLVETTFTLLFLVLLARIRPGILDRAREQAQRSRRRDLLVAVVGGIVACFVSWTALSSSTAAEKTVKAELVRRAGDAHAGDVVTAILTDFRGLDTAGEISVIAVALLGAAAVRRSSRP